MSKDKKPEHERRAMQRFPVNIDIEWEGAIGRQKGTISDISSLGCFILCSGEVDNSEDVNIFIPLGDGMKLQFPGEVINHVFEIGFGVRFRQLNKAQQQFLDSIIESVAE
ncbi:MAG: PilZ domain-containing protein [Pyrinomonadaceae bacterium]